jgi:S-(hydroxymethyl)mycothiol dehydrogenase
MRTRDGAVLGRVLGLGTFCTHTVVHAAQTLPLATDLDPAAVCLIGCGVATGVGAAIHAARVTPGSTVALFGCGAVGCSVIQGARIAGASRIVAVDLVARKLEWARAFGATDLVDASAGDAVKEVRALVPGGVQFSFEAVGLPLPLQQALAVCEPGGVCTMIGVPAPKAELTLSLARFFFNRGHLRATHYGDCLPSRDFPLLADLYRRKRLDLDGLVSRRIALDEVEAAFGALERGETLRSVIQF